MAFSLSKSRFFGSAFRRPMASLSLTGRLPTSSSVSPLSSPNLTWAENPIGQTVSNTSSLHTSAPLSALKEEDRNRDNLSNEYEQAKQTQFKKREEGKAEWHENLASSSEADVKADRGEISYTETQEMEKEIQKGKLKKGDHTQKNN